MSERSAERSEMIAALAWLAAAIAAALVVFFGFRMFDGTDPAAGLVFGGVAFVVVGMLMVFRGPGPKAADDGMVAGHEPYHGHSHDHGHGHDHDHGHSHAPAPAPVAAPVVAAPVLTEAPGVEAAAGGASERVRDAARAAGEAARMALGDAVPATKPVTFAAMPAGGGDDLKRISGIGSKFEGLLHGLGIYNFQQVADWGPGEVAWVESSLEGFRGRVTRDDWIGQAKILAAGGETEHSQRVDRGEA